MRSKSKVAVVCVLLVTMLASVMGGCAKAELKYSLYDLNKAMCDVAEFEEMAYVSSQDSEPEELLAYVSDIEYDKVEDFFINYAVDGTGNADEIACIKVKSEKDLAVAEKSLNAHLEKRKQLYSSYDRSQLNKLSGAIIAKYDKVCVLIVGDNASKIEQAFYDYFAQIK